MPDSTNAALELGATPYVVVALYLLVLLGLGLVGFLRSKQGEEDYYLAGRNQGWLVTALTITATFFSSFAMLGAPGQVYKEGVVFTIFALNVPLAGLSVYLLGGRIWAVGRKKGYVTSADMISDYYGSPVALRLLVAVTGFLYAIPYIMMQIKAGGEISAGMFQGLHLSLGPLDFDAFQIGAVVLAMITMLYVLVGGMRSVAWTDVLQGLLLMGGMLLGGFAMVATFGGLREFGQAVSQLPVEARTSPGLTGAWPWSKMFTVCLLASVGSMVQPAQWMRYYAARNRTALKRGAMVFSLALPPCFLFGVMLVGLGGQALYPLTETPAGGFNPAAEVGQFDRILVVALKDQLPALLGQTVGVTLASLVIVAIMAASMSTADSNLHAVSAVAVRDIYDRYIRPQASERERLWIGRLVIVAATLISLFFVLKTPAAATDTRDFMKMIALMGLLAIGFSAQLLPLTIDMLFLRKGTAAGAAWGLAAGLLGALLFGQLYPPLAETFPVHQSVWGLVFNVPIFIVVSALTRKVPQERRDEFAELMK